MRKKYINIIISIIIFSITLLSIMYLYKNNNMSTEVGQTNNDEINNTKERVKGDKEVYATLTTNSSWAIDPTVGENLIEEQTSVIKIKVNKLNESMFLKDVSTVNPVIPIDVEVIDTLSGNKIKGNMTIYMEGGIVKISDIIKENNPEYEKMELNKLSEEEQQQKYISFETDYDYQLEEGKEYVVLVDKLDTNIYKIVANGYGIFKEETSNSKARTAEPILKNVLTGKEL